MSRRTDHEELLADVLAEESRAGFSAALLDETLRHARRRRRVRQVFRAGGGLGLLLIFGLVLWRYFPREMETGQIARSRASPAACQRIVSQPLSAGQLIHTQPGAVAMVETEPALTGQVQTRSGGFREVGDEELLSLAEPQIAVLIRRGPREAELVFVTSSGDAMERRN